MNSALKELPRCFGEGELKWTIVPPSEFALISEQLFGLTFGAKRNKELERIDFSVLLSVRGKLSGFVTCYEHQANELYLQYGGALPEFRENPAVLRGYRVLLGFLLEHYSSLLTRIENTNTPMLKLALRCGWLIIGLRLAGNGKVLLELVNSAEQFKTSNKTPAPDSLRISEGGGVKLSRSDAEKDLPKEEI